MQLMGYGMITTTIMSQAMVATHMFQVIREGVVRRGGRTMAKGMYRRVAQSVWIPSAKPVGLIMYRGPSQLAYAAQFQIASSTACIRSRDQEIRIFLGWSWAHYEGIFRIIIHVCSWLHLAIGSCTTFIECAIALGIPVGSSD